MNTYFVWESAPLTDDEFDELSKIVNAHLPIVSEFPELETGDWEVFFDQRMIQKTEFIAHIDANFLSRLIELFSEQPQISSQCRAVAALMALAISLGIEINQTIAIHEFALTAESNPLERERYFQYANNLHPKEYLAVIRNAQKCLRIPRECRQRCEEHESFFPIEGYAKNHLAILKLLTINTRPENQKDNRIESRAARMMELIRWMYDDFFVLGPVILLAHQVWGNNPDRAVLKNAMSRNADKLLVNARNAAWDLVLAESWSRLETERRPNVDPINLLFTLDKPLARLARRLLFVDRPGDTKWTADVVAREFWNDDCARQIVDVHDWCMLRLDDPNRAMNRGVPYENREAIHEEFEDEIRRNLGQ